MRKKQFEKLVEEGMEKIPKKFREKIKNVAIIILDTPTSEQLQENGLLDEDALLGLYEGIPLTERGIDYGQQPTLPDRIFIFQKPIEAEAGNDTDRIRQVVAETLWHEVAHYFGMNEAEVETREKHKRDV